MTIGPGATIHAATIEDCCVIGMGATIMDGAKVRGGERRRRGLWAAARCCCTLACAAAAQPPPLSAHLASHPSRPLQVESRTVVAAGALVPPGAIIPSGQVWAGSPAKFIRTLAEGEWQKISGAVWWMAGWQQCGRWQHRRRRRPQGGGWQPCAAPAALPTIPPTPHAPLTHSTPDEAAFVADSAETTAQLAALHAEENAKSFDEVWGAGGRGSGMRESAEC